MSRPPKRLRLSPQEKKALALQKDRRDSFGQNDKASRRLVPLRKAQSHRKLRRVDKAALRVLDEPETGVPALEKGEFVKFPGAALGDHIARAQDNSKRREGRKLRTEAEWLIWYRRFYGPKVAQRMAHVFALRREESDT